MKLIKKCIAIVICLIIYVVVINANNAFAFNAISEESVKSMVKEEAYNSDITDVNAISIENAVDSICTNSDTCSNNLYCYDNVYGSVSEVVPENVTGSIEEVATYDNTSTEYYEEESLGDDNIEIASGGIGQAATIDYEVENWQELEGSLLIKVNKEQSCVTIYKGDVPIKSMVCSAGESTPEGTFNMQSKWEWLQLIESQYGLYCSQISGDYLFHSVPYNSMDHYDLDTDMYNQLGTMCSHGCVRLQVEDAKWIFDNCDEGTEIVIYSDSNPGPLGKPEFEQIPSNQTWDPTDTTIEVY